MKEKFEALPPAPTILLTDDDPDTVVISPARLEHHGSRVLVARNGAEGLVLARAHRPDLILMDLEMPVMDGLTAIRTLRRDPETAGIPVVAFTIHDRVHAARTLFDGYLVKPCPSELIRMEVERLLRSAAEAECPGPEIPPG